MQAPSGQMTGPALRALLEDGAAGVHVATHESWSGQPVQADVTGMQSALDKSLTDWLGHLKAAAEDPV